MVLKNEEVVMNMLPEQLSGMVLAGGFSTRMGRDKATLMLGDRSMLEHQVQKLMHLGIQDVMLSGAGQTLPGCRTVEDIYPHRGPLSGVHACLAAARQKACLVLSVDVPLVPEEALSNLIGIHQGGITALEHNGRVEPLIAVYDCSLQREAERLLKSEKTAIMRLLDGDLLHTVSWSGPAFLLTNCNTPEDYEIIRTYWRKQ